MAAAAPSGAAAGRRTGRSSGGAPGSVDGRLKLTEQGEVIAANYADPAIARRHLEQLTGAALIASTPEHDAAAAEALREGAPMLAELADTARAAYRALVHDDPGFAEFFRDITPIAELSDLRLGSRPAARGRAGRRGRCPRSTPCARSRGPSPGPSRASTCPAGTAWARRSRRYRAAHGDGGLAEIGRLYRSWPFLASVLDNAEMILAKADMGVARRYASLATEPGWRAPLGDDRGGVPPHGRVAPAGHRPRPPARRGAGAAALDRPAQPVRRRAVRAPGPPARAAPRAGRPTTRSAKRCCASSSCRSTASRPACRTPARSGWFRAVSSGRSTRP